MKMKSWKKTFSTLSILLLKCLLQISITSNMYCVMRQVLYIKNYLDLNHYYFDFSLQFSLNPQMASHGDHVRCSSKGLGVRV